MEIEEYSRQAAKTIQQNTERKSEKIFLMGLLGEIGEIATAIKKATQDEAATNSKHSKKRVKERVEEELGDALWYINALANQYSHTLEKVFNQSLLAVFEKSESCEPPTVTTIEDYQEKVEAKLAEEKEETKTIYKVFSGLCENFSEIKNPKEAIKPLSDILSYCAFAVRIYSLNLSNVAQKNIDKITNLYDVTSDDNYESLDEGFPKDEQFPKKIEFVFYDHEKSIKIYVNKVIIGDKLTDNSSEEDGYRYHDVFHIANMAILGWSPVMRGMLKRKRKSDPKTDENEDGARAAILEEAIVAYVFQYAKDNNFFSNEEEVEAPILSTIQSLTKNLEVSKRRAADWRKAIKQGFECFKGLQGNKGGVIVADLTEKKITYARNAEDSDILEGNL